VAILLCDDITPNIIQSREGKFKELVGLVYETVYELTFMGTTKITTTE